GPGGADAPIHALHGARAGGAGRDGPVTPDRPSGAAPPLFRTRPPLPPRPQWRRPQPRRPAAKRGRGLSTAPPGQRLWLRGGKRSSVYYRAESAEDAEGWEKSDSRGGAETRR